MWIYCSGDGDLYLDDLYQGRGYSGFGAGKNNPHWDHVPQMGPIPRGMWTISEPIVHAGLAAPVLRLTPQAGTEVYGRSGFLMHGDKIVAPGTASHGCIIMGHALRAVVAASADKILKVVAARL